jgi:hypothetical protein
MDRRIPVFARLELLHAAAGTRSASACDLYRLADASLARCHDGRRAVCATWHRLHYGVELRLRRLRQCAGSHGIFLRTEGCGARDSVAGDLSGREPCPQEQPNARACRCCFHRHLLFRRAVSVNSARRRDHRLHRCALRFPRVPGRRRRTWTRGQRDHRP